MKNILKIGWLLAGIILLVILVMFFRGGWGCGYSNGHDFWCSLADSLGSALGILVLILFVTSIAYKVSENNRLNKLATESEENKQKRKKDVRFLITISAGLVAFVLLFYLFITFVLGAN